jgi:CubicO group peptidase (beta-lactamase class C family)
VTKPFVAALVLGLVADGRLGLDEPVARQLPKLHRTDVRSRCASYSGTPRGSMITRTSSIPTAFGGRASWSRSPRAARASAGRVSASRTRARTTSCSACSPSGSPAGRWAAALEQRLLRPLRLRATRYLPDAGPRANFVRG